MYLTLKQLLYAVSFVYKYYCLFELLLVLHGDLVNMKIHIKTQVRAAVVQSLNNEQLFTTPLALVGQRAKWRLITGHLNHELVTFSQGKYLQLYTGLTWTTTTSSS